MKSKILILSILLLVISAVFAFGQNIWSRTYGGSGWQSGSAGLELAGGDLIALGVSSLSAWLLKTNANGDLLWSREYNFPSHSVTSPISFAQTEDGGFIISVRVGASATPAARLIKTDSTGLQLWTNEIPSEVSRSSLVVLPVYGQKYLLAGTSNFLHEIVLIEVDSLGDTLGTRAIQFDYTVYLFAFEPLMDGNILVAARPRGQTPNTVLELVEIDGDRNIMWSQSIATNLDWLEAIAFTDDRNIVLVGIDSDGKEIIKFMNFDGSISWERTITFPQIYADIRVADISIVESGFLLTGELEMRDGERIDDIFLARLNSEGEQIWLQTYGNSRSQNNAYSLFTTNDGGSVIVGRWEMPGGTFDLLLIKTDSLGNTITDIEQAPENPVNTFQLSQNYPNPFNPSTTIRYTLPAAAEVSITVFDIAGRQVAAYPQGRRSVGEHSFEWDAGEFASGVYFYQLRAGDYSALRKAVLMK